MTSLSTHVLDTSLGRPAAGVRARLASDGDDTVLAEGVTDADGRIASLGVDLAPGDHVLRFDTGAYFSSSGTEAFYPQVVVVFTVAAGTGHYHLPVLLSPFGYATYRGS